MIAAPPQSLFQTDASGCFCLTLVLPSSQVGRLRVFLETDHVVVKADFQDKERYETLVRLPEQARCRTCFPVLRDRQLHLTLLPEQEPAEFTCLQPAG